MTKRDAHNRKPYSGNQNVRFYEQEYALPATLWRGSLLCKVSGVIAAIAVLPIVVSAASFTYYPLNSEPPFDWGTESNWYTNSSAYNILPSLSTNALPTSSDDVLIQTWGGVSPVSPVVIGKDQVVSINNLHIAAHNGNNKPRYGTGASLTVDGGMLNVLGKLVFAPHNFTYGTLALTNNATMSVGGDAELGENNYTTAGHCRMEIDETSSFSVGGAMTVGRRARCMASIVTNRGSMTVGSLMLGPCARYFAGTGIVHNVGSIHVEGTLDIGGLGVGGSGGASANYSWSRGELVLAEGSTLSLGASSKIYVGGNSFDYSYGDGILDTSIPIVLTGDQSISIGNGYKGAKNGGVLILRKTARLDNSSSALDICNDISGSKGAIRMYDDSSITNVTKFRFGEYANSESLLEMHDRAVITNVTNIRLGETLGRTDGKAHILLDGSSAIRFTCTEPVNAGSGFILGTCANNETYLTVKDNAVISGLYRLNSSTVYAGLKTVIRLEGGRVVFKPQSFSTRTSISFGRAENSVNGGLGSISGYGAFTRTDADAPGSSKFMPMACRMHDFAFTADGMGEERDLDMSAISHFNDACYGNLTGTNGWYAVNKGRLLYPRGFKTVGKSLANPAIQVGDYHFPGTNEHGAANSPSLVNAFTLEPVGSALKSYVAYCYAALYAPDRRDYPMNVLKGKDGKVVSVWRIGTSMTKWHTAEPESPWTDWTQMKITFRYDRGAAVDDMPLKLYHHDGTSEGRWRRVSRLDAPTENALISGTVEPGAGMWNIGWFALVSQKDAGMVLIVK